MSCLIDKLAKQHKTYESRWLTFVLGISKIINATVLMSLYGWRVEWDRKFNVCLAFVLLTLVTYGIEWGLDVVWWTNWRGTFWRENHNTKLIVCAHSPFYSGTFHITMFLKNSGTFFQKLGKPVVDETYDFTQFFTEGGLFLEDAWKVHCDKLIARSLNAKAE
jgi:hypothetical protein